MKITHALAIGLLTALAALPAVAQQVEIEAARPGGERPAEIVAPGLRYEMTRPDDADFYPYGPRVRHDPAFVEPFVADTEGAESTGRVGLSGWTAPNTPVGPAATGYRDVSGWFALGITVTWGGPPPAKRQVR